MAIFVHIWGKNVKIKEGGQKREKLCQYSRGSTPHYSNFKKLKKCTL